MNKFNYIWKKSSGPCVAIIIIIIIIFFLTKFMVWPSLLMKSGKSCENSKMRVPYKITSKMRNLF